MRVGFWWISVYTLKVAAGAFIAGVWLWQRAPHAGFDRRMMRFWICGAALAALIAGRVGYVLGNTTYFAQHPVLLLRLDRVGGLHGSSAMIGALLVAGLWAVVKHYTVSAVVSFLSPAVLFTAVGAWWGCIDTGCAWGRETLAAVGGAQWLTALLPDIYQTVTLRYAVQPLGAVWALVMALLAVALGKHGGLALVLYWFGSAGLTLLRADPVPMIGLRLDTVLDLILALLITILMLHKVKGTHRG
ncbi:MAG: prolipoprotein diacylglyceryl transferase [Anaerolineae bacterium]|nr:prolipoprotein diacylglyceryl transferase [Anaerolineae bacterium]